MQARNRLGFGLAVVMIVAMLGLPMPSLAQDTPPSPTTEPPVSRSALPAGIRVDYPPIPAFFAADPGLAAMGMVLYDVRLAADTPLLCEGMEGVYDLTRFLDDLFGDNPGAEAEGQRKEGGLMMCQGRYEEAKEWYESALEASRDNVSRAIALHNIGVSYERQGRYQEAEGKLREALAEWRAAQDAVGEGTTLTDIGLILSYQGRYEEALLELQKARETWLRGTDPAEQSRTLYSTGGVYQALGLPEQALEHYRQALAVAGGLPDQTGAGVEAKHQGEWATLTASGKLDWTLFGNLGALYDSLSRFDEAIDAYQIMSMLAEALGDEMRNAGALNNMGLVQYHQGQDAAAQESFEAALAIVRAREDIASEGVILNNLGLLHLRMGQSDRALQAFEFALAALSESDEVAGVGITLAHVGLVHEWHGATQEALDAYRQAITKIESVGRELSVQPFKIGFAASYTWIYQRLVSLLVGTDLVAEAFKTSEQARARAFLDSLGAGQVRLALEEARVDGTSASTVLDLNAVKQALDADTTLVSYFSLGDSGSLAFVVTSEGVSIVTLPLATPDHLQTALKNLYTWPNPDNPYPLPLRELYDWLVAPLQDQLRTPRVGLVLHQLLHYVPFASLTDGNHYFSQEHELYVLPSASALPFIQRNAVQGNGGNAVVFGDPTTDVLDLTPLAYAREEAAFVAGLFGVPAYTGSEASEAHLSAEAGGAKVIHLAAHGQYNSTNSLYSTIYLAPGGDEDGQLQVQEVYDLNLKGNQLVVLSACQTNVGAVSSGDDVVGLTRAFFFAGAPSVIASLWPVDDAATGVLMTSFYRNWLGGKTKAGALQAAQAEVRSDPRWASPFFWAGFVLNGDPGQPQKPPLLPAPLPERSDEKARTTLPFVVLGVAGFALIAVVAVWLIRRQMVQ